jgi:hypothetical protein
MKSVRNNLLKYDIFFNGNKKASWTYIEAFYASDKSKPLQLAPKLTNIIDYKNIKTCNLMGTKYARKSAWHWDGDTNANPPGFCRLRSSIRLHLSFYRRAMHF